MRYFVTTNKGLFDSENYQIISSLNEALLVTGLNKCKYLGLDTETSGLDCHSKKLLLVQIGNEKDQIAIDWENRTDSDYGTLKQLLESEDITFILANAKFDLKFFYKINITIKKVYDVMLVEQLLYIGYPHTLKGLSDEYISKYVEVWNKYPGFEFFDSRTKKAYIERDTPEVAVAMYEHSGCSLKAISYRYLNIERDKTIRGKIQWMGITDEVIVYGCEDVEFLPELMRKQYERVKEEELEQAVNLENNFVRALAYIEFCGIKLDISAWTNKMVEDRKRLNEAEQSLNNWVINEYKKSTNTYKDFVRVNLQGDLFTGFDSEPKCIINWNSQKDLIKFFKVLGVDVKTIDKKTKQDKESVDIKLLLAQSDKSEIIPIYEQYTRAAKVTSSFGQTWIDAINPVTGRIHTNFNQLGADSGRVSCGGKDKDNKVEYVNLQQLPATAETRACFIVEPNNMMICCDYSG